MPPEYLWDRLNKKCPLCQQNLYSAIKFNAIGFVCDQCLHYSSFYVDHQLKSEFFRISETSIIGRDWCDQYSAWLYYQSAETVFYYGEIRNFFSASGLGQTLNITAVINPEDYNIKAMKERIDKYLLLI